MRVTIRGGTARHDAGSLCLSCRYATVIRGASMRDEIVECSLLSRANKRIAFPVTFCNSYVDRTHPTVAEMEDSAWILRTDPRRNTMGFAKASSLKPAERYALTEDW